MCVNLIFRSTTTSPNQALIEAASIAIWNKNNIAVALAIGTWIINVVFLILGMSFPFQLPQVVCNHANVFVVIGPVRVSHGSENIDYLWASLTFNLSVDALCLGIGPIQLRGS